MIKHRLISLRFESEQYSLQAHSSGDVKTTDGKVMAGPSTQPRILSRAMPISPVFRMDGEARRLEQKIDLQKVRHLRPSRKPTFFSGKTSLVRGKFEAKAMVVAKTIVSDQERMPGALEAIVRR